MGAAKKSRLSDLHAKFTEALIKELEDANVQEIPLPAADKSVIAKFLKDNEITADADDEALGRLDNAFQDEMEAARRKRASQIMGKLTDGEDPLAGVL